MLKIIRFAANFIVVLIVICTLTAAIGTAIFHKPVLLTVIKSNSMYPLWQRGDMLVIQNIPADTPVHKGDMIIFRSERGFLSTKGWIAHRIVGGNAKKGFITKGDANAESDQALKEAPRIQRDWIAARVVSIDGHPLVLPKIGFLTLWVHQIQSAKFVLPLVALLLAGIIAYAEITGKKKKKRSRKSDLPLMYIGAGLTMMIVAGATMMMDSQFITLSYEVSVNNGVLSGSPVGILQQGETKTGQLAKLKNTGFIPFTGVVSNHDRQVTVSPSFFSLHNDETLNLKYTVRAETKGTFHTPIKIGLFYPLLPSFIIKKAAEINYWFALVLVSAIPALPFIAYPFLDRRMRKPMKKGFRKRFRRLFY